MERRESLPKILSAFLDGSLDNRTFHHRDHLAVAFEILQRHDFPASAAIFCSSLKSIAARADKPQAFHTTITLAFLSLIAERCARTRYSDFDAFANDNPDLFAKSALDHLYSRERLNSDVARNTFILPDAVR